MIDAVLEVIGDTTAVSGCEPAQVRITNSKREPIEVVMGCIDFRLSRKEALELADLLTKASFRSR